MKSDLVFLRTSKEAIREPYSSVCLMTSIELCTPESVLTSYTWLQQKGVTQGQHHHCADKYIYIKPRLHTASRHG